jgi:TerB N-terminal domain
MATPVGNGIVRAAADGFPPSQSGRLPAVEIPPCKIYYPSYAQFTPEQQRAYVYWRQELLSGVIIEVPLTYRFLYAYEIGCRSANLVELEKHLAYLRNSYRADEHFASYIASWLVSARLWRRDFSYDELIESAPDVRLRVDLALLNARAPSTDDLVQLVYGHGQRDRLVQALRVVRAAEAADVVVAAAASTAPSHRGYVAFSGYPVKIRGVASRAIDVPTYTNMAQDPVMLVIARLMTASEVLIGDLLSPADRELQFVQRTGTGSAIPIRRDSAATVLPVLPSSDTVEGLRLSINGLWDADMRITMAVVLWQAEIKPYVEGEIAFSRDLRKKHEAFTAELGIDGGIGALRRGFFYLTRGPRAPWRLDVEAPVAADLRMGTACARFTTELQHQLRGSATRARILADLIEQVAQDTRKSRPEIVAALVAGTGAEPPLGLQA